MALPAVGSSGWGPILNSQILTDEANAAQTSSNLSGHLTNTPADPHGDRAYSDSKLAVVTSGTNSANGYVVLDGTGHIPVALMPSGSVLNNWYDVKNTTFGAVGTGTVDDSTAINAATAAAKAAGGGVVWVPDGLYGIGSPLITYSGVLLLLSPGATIQRISPVAPPQVMLQNYSPSVAASTGAHWVMGGKWDAIGTTNQTSSCSIFSFVNAGSLYIQNATLNQVSNGASPYGSFYGSNNVTIQNLTLTGAASTVSRGSVTQPCFRIEQTNSSNIPGLISGDYTGSRTCNNVNILNTNLSATTSSDGSGTFTAWHSMAGTTGTVNSSALFHVNISVNLCDATAFANAGISGLNWNQVIYTSNMFNNPGPGNSYNQNWVSSAPNPVAWIVNDVEQPRVQLAAGTLTTTSSSPQTIGSVQVLKGYTYNVKAFAVFNGTDEDSKFSFGLAGASMSQAALGYSLSLPAVVSSRDNDGDLDNASLVFVNNLAYGSVFNPSVEYVPGPNSFTLTINGFLAASANGQVNFQFSTTGGTLNVSSGTLELTTIYS